MKKYLILLMIFSALITISCKKEDHLMWISIKNETKYIIDCNFYPTKLADGYTTFSSIDTMQQIDIYSSDNMDQKPTDLLEKVYDSIIITISGLNKDLVFKKDIVKNYKLNPYTDVDSWVLEKFTKNFPTNTSRNSKEIDNYYFSIKLEDLTE